MAISKARRQWAKQTYDMCKKKTAAEIFSYLRGQYGTDHEALAYLNWREIDDLQYYGNDQSQLWESAHSAVLELHSEIVPNSNGLTAEQVNRLKKRNQSYKHYKSMTAKQLYQEILSDYPNDQEILDSVKSSRNYHKRDDAEKQWRAAHALLVDLYTYY